MNTDTLRTELAKPEYAEISDAQALARLQESVAARKLVPLWQVKKLLLESFEWPKLVAAQASAVPEVAGAALSAVAYIDDQRFENLDLDLPSTKAMLAALVAGGVIGQATSDAADALANTTTTRAASLGIPDVGEGHIASIRLGY